MTLKTSIKKAGQSYVDEAVYLKPKRPSAISMSVAEALRPNERIKLPPELLAGYERTRLRWMKPDGHGGLAPK